MNAQAEPKIIVFANDDIGLRSQYSLILQEKFPSVVLRFAGDYEEACRETQNEGVVAVILDNHMPRIAMKERHPEHKDQWQVQPHAVKLCHHIRQTERPGSMPIYIFASQVSREERVALESMRAAIAPAMDHTGFRMLLDDLSRKLNLKFHIPGDYPRKLNEGWTR